MNILVTGGAGYIGSTCVKELVDLGHNTIVVDNLENSDGSYLDKRAKFHKIDLSKDEDLNKLNQVFQNKIDAVIHFAGYKSVAEAVKNPQKYSDNIIGTLNLLDLMGTHKVKKLIYSSSAAVYGVPQYTPVDENHQTIPLNHYGFTKLECEKLIQWYSKLYDINYVLLRYFNVAGDSGLKYVDPNAENVFPKIMQALIGNKVFKIYGNNHDTSDGTCIRDYIHLSDLVRAHILALDTAQSAIINLGTSVGVSVLELVESFNRLSIFYNHLFL